MGFSDAYMMRNGDWLVAVCFKVILIVWMLYWSMPVNMGDAYLILVILIGWDCIVRLCDAMGYGSIILIDWCLFWWWGMMYWLMPVAMYDAGDSYLMRNGALSDYVMLWMLDGIWFWWFLFDEEWCIVCCFDFFSFEFFGWVGQIVVLVIVSNIWHIDLVFKLKMFLINLY